MRAPRRRPPVQKALALNAWPKADRQGWLAALKGGGPLDDGGLASHLGTRTRDDLTKRYAYFLDYLATRGRLDLEGPAAANVTRQNVLDYVDFIEPRLSSVTLAQSLYKIARVAVCIAPGRDWRWLRRIVRRLEARATPRDKRADVVEIMELRALGIELMERAEKDDEMRPAARAALYRDGLIITLLSADPLRLSNIRPLEIGHTICKDGDSWSTVIPREEAKNRRHRIAILPDWITPYLDRYIETYRPCFSGFEETNALWLSSSGGPLSEGGFARVVAGRTEAAFGKVINVHLFRDCLVTSTAIHHGAHMGLAMTILGHQRAKTTQKHYNQADMIGAVRGYQEMLLEAEDDEEDVS